MALIILLILTEDDGFNRSIHEVVSSHYFDQSYRVTEQTCPQLRFTVALVFLPFPSGNCLQEPDLEMVCFLQIYEVVLFF